MKPFLFSIIIFSLLGLSKCTITKPAAGTNPEVLDNVSEASALLELVRATDIPFSWYTSSGTGTIDWEGQRLSAKIDVRMKKDSVIWVMISKLGFEVGRMLITPDSAFFINRIERTYASYDTPQFFEKYNLPADFRMFSNVFTGGAFIPNDIKSMQVQPDGALLLQTGSGITAQHWLDTDYRLIRSVVSDAADQVWDAKYGNYQKVNSGQLFPFHRANTLTIEGEANVFDLDFTVIEVNIPKELPFSIPSHYEKL